MINKTVCTLRRRALCLAVVAVVALPAMAGEADPALKVAMKRDLKLTDHQLADYQKAERLSVRHGKGLQRQLDRDYGGDWIERGADNSFRYVVASKSAKGHKAPEGVEIRNVRFSLKELDAAKASLDRAFARYADGDSAQGQIYSWGVDPRTNSVVVTVAEGDLQAGIDFIAASGADADAVRLTTSANPPRLKADIVGGVKYNLPVKNVRFESWCSIGFSVTQGANKGFATAGHCGEAQTNVTMGGATVGTFAASNFPGGDYAWVKVGSSHTLKPTVEGYDSADVTVKGSTEAAVGAAVCRSGATSGWHCGTILAKDKTVNYGKEKGVTQIVNGLTHTDACSEGGDSGGAWVTVAGQAQGVTSGGGRYDKCSDTAADNSYFQPLNPLLEAYGLTLLTSP